LNSVSSTLIPRRLLAAFLFLIIFSRPAHAREFDPRHDGFAFSNQTLFAYEFTSTGEIREHTKEHPADFKQRCLCMVRGTLQFWKFARFDPQAPKLTEPEYRQKLRELFRISPWHQTRAAKDRLVFPGYADLWSFSAAHRRLVQEEIGAWLPTYLRVGNWRMAWPFNRLVQGRIARDIARALGAGPQGVYLAKFPHLNHGVVVYAVTPLSDGGLRFKVYDPNYAGQSARLDYLPKSNLFDFEKRFYWPGGDLRAFRIYLSPFQ
jgi:hypothetical protein